MNLSTLNAIYRFLDQVETAFRYSRTCVGDNNNHELSVAGEQLMEKIKAEPIIDDVTKKELTKG